MCGHSCGGRQHCQPRRPGSQPLTVQLGKFVYQKYQEHQKQKKALANTDVSHPSASNTRSVQDASYGSVTEKAPKRQETGDMPPPSYEAAVAEGEEPEVAANGRTSQAPGVRQSGSTSSASSISSLSSISSIDSGRPAPTSSSPAQPSRREARRDRREEYRQAKSALRAERREAKDARRESKRELKAMRRAI